jgi:2-polyprenyl-3-methyl-5-hydroxy-6-metoxy-1,4-benzoquinol methylase
MTPKPAAPERVPVNCPHCGARDGELFTTAVDPLAEAEFQIQRCRRCRLVYLSPQPPEEELGRYYPDGYYGRRHRVFRDFFMNLRLRSLPPRRTEGRLLDIGCGHGEFLLACRREGWKVIGVEHEGAPIMEMRSSLGLEVMTTNELSSLADASFDVVTMWHVLEHMTAPREILAQAFRLLRPGGTLVVEVPNLGSWQARMGPRYWFHLDAPRHLVHFERDTLGAMLEAEGLQADSWATFSAEYDTFGIVQSLLNRVCDTQAYLFQILIDRRWPGTWRDVVITSVATVPLTLLASVFSLIAPLFRQGGVLRVVSRKPSATVSQ